jgi:S1-C subfamily serine protease
MTLKNDSRILGIDAHAIEKNIKRATCHLTWRDHSQSEFPGRRSQARRRVINYQITGFHRLGGCWRPVVPLIFILILVFLTACSSAGGEDAVVRSAVATVEAGLPPALPGGGAAPGSDAANLEGALTAVYEKVNPSVVYIISYAAGAAYSSGSGFVYDRDGHVVTNNHVVALGDRFEVVFSDRSRRKATLAGTDPDSDLAVLHVDSLPNGVGPVTLAHPGALRVGQFVAAIGNPFGEQGSISLGIISGLGRRIRSQRDTPGGIYSLPDVIQTDAPINVGNSGGPLLDLRGEVVGVSSAIRTDTGFNSGVGFAIPVRAVQRIVPALIADGGYTYPWIGLSTLPEDLDLQLQEALELDRTTGVYVTGVVENGPSAQAGLIAAPSGQGPVGVGPGGDLIVAIDGNEVKDFNDLISYLVFETEVGQSVQLTVLRAGQTLTVPVTLGERP